MTGVSNGALAEPRGSFRHDLVVVALSAIPGLITAILLFVLEPQLVMRGWPLVAILCLGLFAGSLAALGARHPSDS